MSNAIIQPSNIQKQYPVWTKKQGYFYICAPDKAFYKILFEKTASDYLFTCTDARHELYSVNYRLSFLQEKAINDLIETDKWIILMN